MYKQWLTIVLLISSTTTVFAEKQSCAVSFLETLTGTLINKPWTKNTESYCAQGGDYFVLRILDQDLVLSGEYQIFRPLVNKMVIITGYRCEKIIPNPNQFGPNQGTGPQVPIVQAPIGNEFECQIFRVRNIEEFQLDKKILR